MDSDEYDSIMEKLTELVIRSEERIDKTNNMIEKCVAMVDKLATEYASHIKSLQNARDEVIRQNTELIKCLRSKEELLEYTNRKYDLLLEKTFGIMSKNSSENNINVK